jgi:uncharacterized membrane protein YccC
VLLVPTFSDASPITSAADRVFEVGLGAVMGLAISLVLFPSSAYGSAIEVAARTIERLAHGLGELMAGLKWGLDVAALHRVQDGIGEALTQLSLAGADAERERAVRFSSGPDTGPLLLTLLRLRHDLVMIGRCGFALARGLACPTRPTHRYCDSRRRFSPRERARAPRSQPSSPARSRGIGARLLCGGNRHGAR